MEIDDIEMQEIDNIFNDAYKKTTTLREAWRYAMMRYAEIYHDREVKKLNEPDVSVNEAFGFRRGVAGCPLCKGRGEYHTGGSFGGEVQIHQCECTKGQTEH